MARRSRLVAGIGGAATAVGLLAVQFTGGWEGLRLAAYQDVIGVWTACYGETKGIRPGMKFTQDKCDSMFIASLTEHEAGMRACLKAPDTIPDRTYVALVSFTYNVGTGAFCRSTLRRLADAGNLKAACEQLQRWNRAGGKVVRGLINRRAAELDLCLSGLSGGTVTDAPRPHQKPADPAIKTPRFPGAGEVPIGLLVAAGIGLAGVVAFLVLRRRRKG